jgi:AraC-like DNA-binding protein
MFARTSTIDTVPQDGDAAAYRVAGLGPVSIGEVTFREETRLDCDDAGTGYYVHLPIAGRFRSQYRGIDMTVNGLSSAVYRPGGGSLSARWPAGYRALCIRIDEAAVTTALDRMAVGTGTGRVSIDPVLNLAGGLGRSWAGLAFSVSRQLSVQDGLLSQPLVSAPLAESLVNGFLLAVTQSRPEALARPTTAARPASVRTAIDVIEADPRAPLTLSTLAEHCGVHPRTLQKAFQQHLAMSPMAYARGVRLRGAHEELKAADPFTASVAAVAQRWGFGHLGRFAAAHEAKYGETPLHTLRG